MKRLNFPERPILLAPFGRYTRYLLLNYIRHVLMIGLALLSVALTIDMVPQLSKVTGGLTGLDAVMRAGWFALLRSADLLPRFFPLACFLAVLWSEIALTMSRERLLVWNTGRSPLHCLVPVVMLAVLFGAIQFASDAYLRPAAMKAQIDQNLGTLGETFDRHLSKEANWISSGDDLLFARLEFGPPPVLHDLTLYRLNRNGRLREVNNARSAVPGTRKDSWILQDGSYWVIPPESAQGAASVPLLSRGTRATAIKFTTREVRLTLDPRLIITWGVYPQYLPYSMLAGLASDPTPDDPRLGFRTRFHVNYANALMPGAMALLAATLCLLFFPYSARIGLQLAMLPFGYVGHLAMKTFILLSEHEYIPPLLAAWTAPIAILLLSAVLLAIIEKQRRS